MKIHLRTIYQFNLSYPNALLTVTTQQSQHNISTNMKEKKPSKKIQLEEKFLVNLTLMAFNPHTN